MSCQNDISCILHKVSCGDADEQVGQRSVILMDVAERLGPDYYTGQGPGPGKQRVHHGH